MLTHVMLVRVLILSLLSALIPHADARPTTIPLPIPHLTETTLLQVSRSVPGDPFSKSLMCDLATTRALAQLQIRIQRDLITQRITSDELATAVPPKTIRTWDATHHRCLVTVQIEIPILPRPTVQRSTLEVTRGFVLHVIHQYTHTGSPSSLPSCRHLYREGICDAHTYPRRPDSHVVSGTLLPRPPEISARSQAVCRPYTPSLSQSLWPHGSPEHPTSIAANFVFSEHHVSRYPRVS